MKKTFPYLLAALGLTPGIAFSALYTAGHGDIGIGYEEEEPGVFEFHFHYHLGDDAILDGVAIGLPDGEEFEPGDIVTVIPGSVVQPMPNNASLIAATGVAEGNPIWILPTSETPGVPFLGIATEELEASEWSNITFTLNSATSPSGSGDFSVWNFSGGGTLQPQFSTEDPSLTVNGDNTLVLAPGVHDHFNMGFSETGDWTVNLTVSGTHNTDGFMSATEDFTFSVVPEPSTSLLSLLSVVGLSMVRRRK